jgi:hypothetical protein
LCGLRLVVADAWIEVGIIVESRETNERTRQYEGPGYPETRWSSHYVVVLASLIFVFCAIWWRQAAYSGWCNDEAAHIAAGLYHWDTSRFDSYQVNPPFPRLLATICLRLSSHPRPDWHSEQSRYRRHEFIFAHQWLIINRDSLPCQLLLARLPMLVFAAIGAIAIFRWVFRLYGMSSAIGSATMWLFNPCVVTYSANVNADLPAAAVGLLLGYRYWNWEVTQSRVFPWDVSVLVGACVLCKFTWLMLFALLPLMTLAYDVVDWLRSESQAMEDERQWLQFIKVFSRSLKLVVSFSVSLFVINLGYGFEGSFNTLDSFSFISRALSGKSLEEPESGNRFYGGMLASVPSPFPREMVHGIDYLKWELEQGKASYMRGQWKEVGSNWFYVYAMLVKVPLGHLCLLVFSAATCVRWMSTKRNPASADWISAIIGIAVIVVVSSSAGFTHHVRYVLPAYGFIYVFMGRLLYCCSFNYWKALWIALIGWPLVFHFQYLGLSHTYFNALGGGPNEGWRCLSFSNVDWGQSTYRLAEFARRHPDHRPLTILFRSTLGDPGALVSDLHDVYTDKVCFTLDAGARMVPERRGWYALSSFQMTLPENRFFWDKIPVVRPSPDILVFLIE